MEKRISGHTGLMGLFGSPVGHSGSPAMYNFSFQHDGLDYAYLAFDVTEEEMPKAFEAIRLFNMRAGNFTMPCKNIAAKLVDKLSPAAEIIGACNAFVNDNGVITGYITDGVGFVKNLEINGVSVKDKKIVVLGAGGAATAIQVQLALDGAKEINIFSIQENCRNAGIDECRLKFANARHAERIHQIACREHRAAVFPVIGRVQKLNLHFRRRKGHAVQLKSAGFLHQAISHRHMRNNGFLNIGLPNTDCANAIFRNTFRCN